MAGSPTNTRSMRAIGALCRDAGLRVLEASGWTDRGRTWSTLRPEYVVCHHTAATIDVDRVLIDGRLDLPGPLCNFALHADGTVVLIASGLANHAGVATISSDQAYGIEATGPIPLSGSGPAAFPQYNEYVTLCAAICLHHGWPIRRVVAHKEIARPDGRKPNPAFGSRAPAPYPDMDTFRAAVTRRVANWGLTEEDDMTTDELLDALESTRGQRALEKAVGRVLRIAVGPDDASVPAGVWFGRVDANVEAIKGDVNLLVKRTGPPA